LLLLDRRRISLWAVARAIVVSALYTLGLMVAFRQIAAPGGNSIVELMSGVVASPAAGVWAILARVPPNVEATYFGGRYGVAQAWLYSVLLVVLPVTAGWTWLRRRSAGFVVAAETGARAEG